MKKIAYALIIATALTGCTALNDRILGNDNQSTLAKRSYQSRLFATNSDKVLRNVVSTLQDQDYVIERADKELSVVTASKANGVSRTKITVTVRAKEKDQTIVRANAVKNFDQIEDPKFYQVFFNALAQSLFLEAQSID
ncbi:MAG: hypothetical protein ACOYBQ_08155 [Fluviibacter sp.]